MNAQTMRKIAQIIVAFSEMLYFKTISIFLTLKLNECIFGAVIFEVIKMAGQKLEIEV